MRETFRYWAALLLGQEQQPRHDASGQTSHSRQNSQRGRAAPVRRAFRRAVSALGSGTLTVLLVMAAALLPTSAPAADATTLGFASAFVGSGAGGNANGRGIAVSASGVVHTIGTFSGTIDFDPGAGTSTLSSVGILDGYAARLDASGNYVVGSKLHINGQAEDAGNGVAVDAAGNSYVTGRFADASTGGFTSAYVVKQAPNNDIVWTKFFNASGSGFAEGLSIAVDGSGNSYVTGRFSGGIDFDPNAGTTNLFSVGGQDVFAVKLDSSGALVWAKQMGGTQDDLGKGIAVDGSGNVYLTGTFSGLADFDPGSGIFNLASPGNQNFFVVKLNSSGALVWADQFGDAGFESGNAIAVDGAGNVYVTGIFGPPVDFDPGPGVIFLNAPALSAVFVVKLNSSGGLVWAKSVGSTSVDNGNGIAVDGAGNVYLIGRFGGSSDFDPGAATFYLASEGGDDVFVLKLDGTGAFVWAERFGSTGDDSGQGVALDAAGNVYLIGDFKGTADFDPGPGTANLVASGTSTGTFVVKLAQVAPPVNGLPAAPQSTLDGTPLVFSTARGNRISVADADNGSSPLRVSLTVSSGTLTLATTAGLSFTLGDGTADASMTMNGALAAINAALDGLTYTPVVGGPAGVTLTMTTLDLLGPSGGQTDVDNLTITVKLRPVAVNDAYSVAAGTVLTVPAATGVLANDTDGDNPATLTAQVVSQPASGTLALQPNGAFTYTPAANVSGPVTFTYKATDATSLQSNTATVTITLTGSAPVAVSGGYTVNNGSTLTVSAGNGVLAGVTDADTGAASVTATVVTAPINGTLTLQANGAFTYTPKASFAGTDTFTYTAIDPQGLRSNPATVLITVNPVACGPRPTVNVTTAVSGGALQATVTATDVNGPSQNGLRSITFGTLENATVTLNGGAIRSGQAVTLPASSATQSFTVRRATPGQPSMVPITVVDACGSWPSFVGGGTAAGY